MFNAIWEFFFCPQHGLFIQCWWMIPGLLAFTWAYIRSVPGRVRRLVVQMRQCLQKKKKAEEALHRLERNGAVT